MKNRPAGPGVRLQKVLARAGIASRRAAEELIRSGRVRVDGRIASELGIRVDPRRARVEVDGKRIVAEPLVYLILHKPRGVVCTLSDPEGRPTVAELLREAGARVAPVGRLDFNTSGALLCTNDGEFANRLAHPSHHAPKEYLVKVGGVIDDAALDAFRRSITIDGRATRPAQVSLVRIEGDKSWLSVRLEEGRNRQVRRLAEEAGFVVMRLVRTAQAGVTVEGLRPGRFRPLGMDELVKLRDEYGVPRRIPKPSLEPVEDRRRVVPRDGRRGSQSEPRGDRREPRRAFQSESRRGGSQSEPRGDRREPRGGAQRESRGGFQRESRGGFQRESRGGFQRESRGGFQRESRGGFQRESRGGSQREPRGGFQRESRGGFQRESRGGQREPGRGSQREPGRGSQREPRRDRRGPRR